MTLYRRVPVRSLSWPLLAATMVALVAGCATDEPRSHDDSPFRLPPVPNALQGSVMATDLIRPGMCLNDTDPAGGDNQRRVLDCAADHRYEVYGVLAAARTPQQESEPAAQNLRRCEDYLTDVLARAGSRTDRDAIVVTVFFDDHGPETQRMVVCALSHGDFHQYRGNLVQHLDANE